MRAPERSRPRAVQVFATLAIAMLIGATGCARRSPVVPRDDVTVAEDVRARLAANPQTKPFAITVGTTAGVVHVAGSVAKPVDRDSVERIARDTPGVRSVDNEVKFGDMPAPVENQ